MVKIKPGNLNLIYMKYIFLSITILFFFSCKKDSYDPIDDATLNSSVAQTIRGNEWLLTANSSSTAIDWDNDGDKETDLYANSTACMQSHKFHFQETTTGWSKFECTSPVSIDWHVQQSGTLLHWRINYGQNAYADYKIVQATANLLKLSYVADFPEGSGFIQTTITSTYTR